MLIGIGTLEYVRTFFWKLRAIGSSVYRAFGLLDLRSIGTFIKLGLVLSDLWYIRPSVYNPPACLHYHYLPSWGIIIIRNIIGLFSQSSFTFALEIWPFILVVHVRQFVKTLFYYCWYLCMCMTCMSYSYCTSSHITHCLSILIDINHAAEYVEHVCGFWEIVGLIECQEKTVIAWGNLEWHRCMWKSNIYSGDNCSIRR